MLRWTHEQHILEDVDPQAAKVQRSNADQTKALVLTVTERSHREKSASGSQSISVSAEDGGEKRLDWHPMQQAEYHPRRLAAMNPVS